MVQMASRCQADAINGYNINRCMYAFIIIEAQYEDQANFLVDYNRNIQICGAFRF